MAGLTETPRANRIRIAFFGLRNAGKSTLVNAFTGQDLAIVCDTPGTTTDPVSKAMEILPLGPCLVTDTAGLDDVGELGEMRVRKTLDVLATTDIAVWVEGEPEAGKGEAAKAAEDVFREACRRQKVTVIEYRRGEDVGDLKRRIAAVKIGEIEPGLLDGLVGKGARVVCVCPIDESAPKGRLILPQVQVIRACLDAQATVTVCRPDDVKGEIGDGAGCDLVVTDSQAFGVVRAAVPASVRLTSFSVLFARQKGDLAEYVRGVEAIRRLADGDLVLVAEGCTHHRQCNDIGSVKIPKALERLSGRRLRFAFASGQTFEPPEGTALVVHCGGCMLTRREMLRRIAQARASGIPIVNYGLVLAAANGIGIGDILVI